MQRNLASGLFFSLAGLSIAYVLATAWLDYVLPQTVGFDYLLLNGLDLQRREPEMLLQVGLGFLLLAVAGFAFGANYASEKLTKHGDSNWQTRSDMRRNKLLGKPGKGFLLAKTTKPSRSGSFITSDEFPNCLVIAPTGAGKGIGFVYPNLLTFEGSTITLDIKGENYETTARWRRQMGDKVYRFAPVAFGEQSYRYNPLERIGKLEEYSQINFELRKIATLFLQADSAGEWINGAIQLFCAFGGVAYQRRDFTLGGIYRVMSEGENNLREHIAALAKSAKIPSLGRELASLAKLEQKTLSSYMSVMNNAGFDLWGNDHVDDMTSASDFSFANIRREKTSIYFVVADGDLKPLAGLVRLFFNELVSTIQAKKPTKDEKFHAMIILDEFHRLGKMSEVADAMTTIRGFNGRIAIITQTIPKLEVIYSHEERLSIQGGAGLKLYMTPSEEMTIEDLSAACGKTTMREITKSKQTGLGQGTTISERTQEIPLLKPDEARRLDKSASIIIVNGKQPIKVKAIRHFEDRTFRTILEKQEKLGWDTINSELMASRMTAIERKQKLTPRAAPNDDLEAKNKKQSKATGSGETAQLTDESLALIKKIAVQAIDDNEAVKALPAKKDNASFVVKRSAGKESDRQGTLAFVGLPALLNEVATSPDPRATEEDAPIDNDAEQAAAGETETEHPNDQKKLL